MLQPSAVGGREIQLGDDLQAQRMQAVDLGGHLLRRPAALDRQLGTTRKGKSLADVDNDLIDALGRRMIRHLPPDVVIAA